MPARAPGVAPRWPLPLQNGTAQASSSSTSKTKPPPDVTPSSIPSPVFESVTVAPASQLTTSTSHAPIPAYSGSGATILQGYCTEPAYTLLDGGATALWVPVVGCISSKADCCPTSTTGASAPAVTTGSNRGGAGGGGDNSGSGGSNGNGGGTGAKNGVGDGAQFPIGQMPSQGTLTAGCPDDYHTVGASACCPSSYWLWSAAMGGQTPCYSSVEAKMTPPPIPDTLAQAVARGSATGSAGTTELITSLAGSITSAAIASQKPTSAIINVAFAVQYTTIPQPQPTLKKEAKIGIGVGVGGAAIILVALIWLVIRKIGCGKRGSKKSGDTGVQERFGAGVDMSRVAHEAPPTTNTYEKGKGGGVYSKPVTGY